MIADADKIVLKGVAHAPDVDPTSDWVIGRARVDPEVFLLADFDVGEGPLGRATVTRRDDGTLDVTAWVHRELSRKLVGRPYLAVMVWAGDDGPEVRYVSVVTETRLAREPYRLTSVPNPPEHDRLLRDYVKRIIVTQAGLHQLHGEPIYDAEGALTGWSVDLEPGTYRIEYDHRRRVSAPSREGNLPSTSVVEDQGESNGNAGEEHQGDAESPG